MEYRLKENTKVIITVTERNKNKNTNKRKSKEKENNYTFKKIKYVFFRQSDLSVLNRIELDIFVSLLLTRLSSNKYSHILVTICYNLINIYLNKVRIISVQRVDRFLLFKLPKYSSKVRFVILICTLISPGAFVRFSYKAKKQAH